MAPITEDRSLLRYAGYAYDAHSGLYYLQRRYYDAILRQFLSRDPLKSDGAESPYQYCRGNPVAGTDPWGLYVTASGGRTNTWFYVPQSHKTYQAGNAPDFLGAPAKGAPLLQSPLNKWGVSLGAAPPPASSMGVPSAQRLVSDFASDFAEWGRFFLGDPEADPLRGSNPVLREHTYAALTALSLFMPTPGGKARAGTIVVSFVDDAVKYGAAGVRWVRTGSEVANTGTRLAQDIAVSRVRVTPRALGIDRSIGRASHNQALQADIAALPRGATDIRVNQQQVNALGRRVGINRPDLQYSLNHQRYYVEYEGLANPRGAAHEARILANDPDANFILRIVP